VNWLTGAWVLLILVGGYFLLVLPRRRMRQDQVRMRSDLGPGDEVITVGGIIGTILVVDDDEVQLEIAPDVVVRVVRRGVAGRLAPPDPDEPDEPDEDDPA
jgi:preprotein translocase subunit YajC